MNTIKKGSRGTDVTALQLALGIKPADGIFGSGTEAAVKDFQKEHGLTADGIVGPATWRAVESMKPEAKPTITLAPITANMGTRNVLIRYISIHYTAGLSSAPGNAMKTRNGFNNPARKASADFCVDDATIVQCNPDIRGKYCWAVGNGGNGIINKNCIHIEMCSTLRDGTNKDVANHEGWTLTKAVLDRTTELVRYLMKEYGVPVERVVRHYDATGKSCPGVVGWNNNTLYDTKGVATKRKNASTAWLKWKASLN